jgi:hypothetical protein
MKKDVILFIPVYLYSSLTLLDICWLKQKLFKKNTAPNEKQKPLITLLRLNLTTLAATKFHRL